MYVYMKQRENDNKNQSKLKIDMHIKTFFYHSVSFCLNFMRKFCEFHL